MAVRSVKIERERGPLQGERSAISAVRKSARRRSGGNARACGRLKRVIRNAERRSGDGREIGGPGATILRLRPAPLVRLIEKQCIGAEEIRAADDITTAFHAQAGEVMIKSPSPEKRDATYHGREPVWVIDALSPSHQQPHPSSHPPHHDVPLL